MNYIEIKNLSKEVPRKDKTMLQILSNINLTINKGECFVIIGPNGSGKTSLLKLIGLLDYPTQGSILFDNIDLSKKSNKERTKYRRKLSFVRQKPVVRNTSVFNNIAYGLKIRGEKYQNYKGSVQDMINVVGLVDMENKNAKTLSGGEIQRVAIAMNFIINPEVYILDEVSANLDPMNIKLLESFIMKIKEEKLKTIIMSTHDPLEAIKFADKICVLNEGKIIQIDSPNELFTNPKNEFIAMFMGYENIFHGVAILEKNTGLSKIKINDLIITASSQQEGKVKVCIRPESIGIVKQIPKNTSLRNTFKGIIEDIRSFGNICHVVVRCQSEKFLITITELSHKKLDLKINSEVFISFKATDITIL